MFPGVSWKMYDVTEGQDWKRLAQLVVEARIGRGLHTREQLAKAGEFSTRFLGDIEKARRTNYDQAYLMRLERALGWQSGSVAAVLDGGDPTPVAAGRTNGHADENEDDELAFEISMIEASGLPPSQIKAMVKFARELQRQQKAERQDLINRQRAERRQQIAAVVDIARGGAQPAT